MARPSPGAQTALLCISLMPKKGLSQPPIPRSLLSLSSGPGTQGGGVSEELAGKGRSLTATGLAACWKERVRTAFADWRWRLKALQKHNLGPDLHLGVLGDAIFEEIHYR